MSVPRRGPTRYAPWWWGAGAAFGLVLAACGSTPTTGTSTTSTSTPATSTTSTSVPKGGTTTGSGVTAWAGTPLSPTAIPLGDGKVSSAPKVGYVDSCSQHFRSAGQGQTTGPWIDTAAGTWDENSKIHVAGSNTWPQASHSFTLSGSKRILTTDDLPAGEPTGNFPIASTTPAYPYDHNPNHVAAQSFSWKVPADPTAAAQPSCLGLGPIGVSTDGVVFFDALDAAGRDAGAHEIQDSCDGHPQGDDVYHYHTFSPCLTSKATTAPGSSTLVGYALDGYGIYVERDSHGNLPTNADLDACHGRTSAVTWDGRRVVMYHYEVTLEYPYTVGCYHGTPVTTHISGQLSGGGRAT